MSFDPNDDKPATKGDIRRLDVGLDKVDDRLDKVDDRFDKVDDRFDKVDDRFDKVDDRFDKVDAKFDKVERNLETVAHQVGTLTSDVAEIKATMATKDDLAALRVELRTEMATGHRKLSAEMAQHANAMMAEVRGIVGVVQEQTAALMERHVRDNHA